MHFFTGQHADYHKPGDDIDKINFKGEVKVLEYIINIIGATENMEKLAFLKTRNPETGKGGFKVTMGIMPDYTYEGKGLHVDGVSDGKAAAKAGVQKGDIIIQLGEFPVNNVQDYMKALSNFKRGDTTIVRVMREGKEVVLNVTF